MGISAQVQILLISHCFCQGRKAAPTPSVIVNALGKVKNLQEKSFIFLFLLFAFSNGLQSAITLWFTLPMCQQQKLAFPNLYLMLETAQHQRIHWFQPHCDILYARLKQTNKKLILFPISYLCNYQQKYHSQNWHSAQHLATCRSSFLISRWQYQTKLSCFLGKSALPQQNI